MVRSKAPSKKQQKRGVDFKKIKRKIGRKLPPPNNATNTEVKSKAIILPEQSVASEKAGLAVSKKGLTLKELLQQTSHHNAKVRKDALIGIRDLLVNHSAELRLHKYAVIEKLRERIGDDDKVVRETLYGLFKSTIFPGCKEDNQGPLISLMMAYIFNAMTHLSIDVRFMAFKFFDLVVQHYPPSFSLYAEKILQNYGDILRKNHLYLQDKSRLKTALAGLVCCLSLLPCDNKETDSSKKDVTERWVLHAFEPDVPKDPAGFAPILKKLMDLLPVLVNCYQDFIPLVQNTPILDAQSFDCMLCILQGIDLAVRFYLYWGHKFHSELRISVPQEPDVGMYGKTTLPVVMGKLFVAFPLDLMHHRSEKDDDRYFILNIVITEIFLRFSEWISPPPVLLNKFLEFIERVLSGQICSSRRSGKALREKHIVSVLPFIPKLVMQVASDWKSRLLQAFTKAFKDFHPESSLKLACLSMVEEMLIPRHGVQYLDASDPEILTHQIIWIRELPLFLIQLGDKHPSSSQVVLRLQLLLGQHALLNPSLVQEYDNLQYSLIEFYSTRLDGCICYGPFLRLPVESQELSICCLCYYSGIDSLVLESLASCCLCPDLEPSVLFRMIEVLHSAYKAGHIRIADHISFFLTLLARFRVFPGNIYHLMENNTEISNRGTFKSITSVICSCLSQMGDGSLLLQMLDKLILDQLSHKPPLDNICALLRMLIGLDSRLSGLCEETIMNLSNILAEFLIDVVRSIPEDDDESHVTKSQYYYLPCFFLFDRNRTILKHVVNMLGSFVTENASSSVSHNYRHDTAEASSKISAIISSLTLMHRDIKLQRILSSCKPEIDCILQKISVFQSSEGSNMTIEEKHKIQFALDRLKMVRSSLPDGG